MDSTGIFCVCSFSTGLFSSLLMDLKACLQQRAPPVLLKNTSCRRLKRSRYQTRDHIAKERKTHFQYTCAAQPCNIGFKLNHKRTHDMNTHAHRAPISSQSPASLSTQVHPPSFHLFFFFFIYWFAHRRILKAASHSAEKSPSRFEHLCPFASIRYSPCCKA